MSTWRRRRKRRKVIIITTIVFSVVIVIAGLLSWQYVKFKQTHYSYGTIIQGVDCSYLTVESAKARIEQQRVQVKFVFLSEMSRDKTRVYNVSQTDFKNFERKIPNTQQLELILQTQQEDKYQKNFVFENFFSLNEAAVRRYLKDVFETQEKFNQVQRDAHLKIGNYGVEIVPEVYGTIVDFEECYQLTLKLLKNGETVIDFTPFVKQPEVFSTDEDLINACEELNTMIKETKITFKTSDGTSINYVLDGNVIKEWIEPTEDGKLYYINVDDNLPAFVSEISKSIENANSTFLFPATGIDSISLKVRKDLIASIDKDDAISQIKSALGKEATITLKYSVIPIEQRLDNYVELDITRQTVWMYKNGECILETLCVTGNVSTNHSTPKGIYFLDWKTTDTYLEGNNDDGTRYKSHVNYWMPFNGGVGFHDAYWRYGRFGGEYYKTNGSHGCVNLPLEAAKTLYENIDTTMLIIVYES